MIAVASSGRAVPLTTRQVLIINLVTGALAAVSVAIQHRRWRRLRCWQEKLEPGERPGNAIASRHPDRSSVQPRQSRSQGRIGNSRHEDRGDPELIIAVLTMAGTAAAMTSGRALSGLIDPAAVASLRAAVIIAVGAISPLAAPLYPSCADTSTTGPPRRGPYAGATWRESESDRPARPGLASA